MKKIVLLTIALVFSIVAFGQKTLTDSQILKLKNKITIDEANGIHYSINCAGCTREQRLLMLWEQAFPKPVKLSKKVVKYDNEITEEQYINILKQKKRYDDSVTNLQRKPKRTDSTTTFTTEQEKVIIKQLKTIEIKDSLNKQLEKKVVKQQEIINNKDLQILDQKTIIDNKQHIIIDKDKEIESKTIENSKLKKQRNFCLKGMVLTSIGFIVLLIL